LGNVKNLSAPDTKTPQSANFQQEAFSDYNANSGKAATRRLKLPATAER
jgi:hypothetical protein